MFNKKGSMCKDFAEVLICSSIGKTLPLSLTRSYTKISAQKKYSGGFSVISYQLTVHQEVDLNRYERCLPQLLKLFLVATMF